MRKSLFTRIHQRLEDLLFEASSPPIPSEGGVRSAAPNEGVFLTVELPVTPFDRATTSPKACAGWWQLAQLTEPSTLSVRSKKRACPSRAQEALSSSLVHVFDAPQSSVTARTSSTIRRNFRRAEEATRGSPSYVAEWQRNGLQGILATECDARSSVAHVM